MKKAVFLITLAIFSFSCKRDKTTKVDSAKEVSQIPYGESGELESGNYSGEGTVTNVAGTTISTEGTVTVDDFSINGKLNIPVGSTLIVNGDLNVGGGANIDIQGTLITTTYTQVGNTYLKNGELVVNGKYTIGGGTTLYIETSKIKVGELVIIGHIQSIQNDLTNAGKYYSVVEFTGSKYLNRGGGTTVCGPILFTTGSDQGASGVTLQDITSTALSNNDNIRTQYALSSTISLFQYDESCSPLSEIPAP